MDMYHSYFFSSCSLLIDRIIEYVKNVIVVHIRLGATMFPIFHLMHTRNQ
jgi:hypothetical protein